MTGEVSPSVMGSLASSNEMAEISRRGESQGLMKNLGAENFIGVW